MENEKYKEELIALGQRIRTLRKDAGKRQVDLEDDCKINHGDISRIENGLTNIEFRTLSNLAIALHVKIGDLFKEETE